MPPNNSMPRAPCKMQLLRVERESGRGLGFPPVLSAPPGSNFTGQLHLLSPFAFVNCRCGSSQSQWRRLPALALWTWNSPCGRRLTHGSPFTRKTAHAAAQLPGPEYAWLKKHKIAFQVLHRYLNPACGGEWAMYYLYIGINEHIFMQHTRIYHKNLSRHIITI